MSALGNKNNKNYASQVINFKNNSCAKNVICFIINLNKFEAPKFFLYKVFVIFNFMCGLWRIPRSFNRFNILELINIKKKT